MQPFESAVAVVTGGASGIGRALCRALAARGARIVVADVNAQGADEVAQGIHTSGSQAEACAVDVADRAAVERLIHDTLARQGRLDYLFNNAGIGFAGDARDVSLDCWQRALDVNLWGVIHGTMAAYPAMVEQGSGHIVNTASLAGLVPAAVQLPYATTKHAVVGLSLSLRCEAADLGVKVSAVCPGHVASGIHRSAEILNADRDKVLAAAPYKQMDSGAAANAILKGVAHNRAIIVFPGHARVLWALYRASPTLMISLAKQTARGFRRLRKS